MDTTNLPKTRSEAKVQGSAYYFTGDPCKHGHIAPRKTKGACVDCLKLEWQRGNETRAEYFRAYNKSEAGQKAKRDYYEKNREEVIARAQARDTTKTTEYKKQHKDRNPADLFESVTTVCARLRDLWPPGRWGAMHSESIQDMRVCRRHAQILPMPAYQYTC